MTGGENTAPVKKKSKVKKGFAIAGIVLGGIVVLLILVVGSYLIYVVADYSRLPDDMPLEVTSNSESVLDGEGTYSIVTYNVGFGAYSPDYTFFMDTGVMKDGKETKGKYGKAISKSDVEKNIAGSIGVLSELSPDFAIIQEVDYDSTRSYKVDERSMFTGMPGYASVFAENYHSSYLMYPLNDPHGKNNAGIVTLSKYRIDDSTRYAFPVDDGFGKFTDLDRCFSVTHVPVREKTLAVISLHMSAYDKGGVIRKQQAELLKSTLESEYAAGNYVIAGGDFNQDLIGDLEKFPSAQNVPEWVSSYDDEDIPEHFSIVADKNSTVGSCRGADIKWERDYTYTCVIDGFIVSDNIDVMSVEIVDTDFAYSDHNPVRLAFEFK